MIKACTSSNRVVAAIMLQDLGAQHFGTRQCESGYLVHIIYYVAGQTVRHYTTLLNCEF